ncbi:hypothetical protein CSKR_102438 [Clonorchis sinensis]|uniref:Uncharacterized protein n=1 Tax=Clonorchis sinensis TaxID=79923 RepID=A0A419QET8_CLOSI|nr:hypothetical protein CSKR_102438 [Clonorchis sinensis]
MLINITLRNTKSYRDRQRNGNAGFCWWNHEKDKNGTGIGTKTTLSHLSAVLNASSLRTIRPDALLSWLVHWDSFSCSTLSVPNCHATQRKHEGWDTARLPKPRQGKSRGRAGRVRTMDLLVCGSNPIRSASRLPLSRLGQPDSIPVLVLPSGGVTARHRKGAAAERFTIPKDLATGVLSSPGCCGRERLDT